MTTLYRQPAGHMINHIPLSAQCPALLHGVFDVRLEGLVVAAVPVVWVDAIVI